MLKLRLPGPHPLKFPRKGALAFSALGRGGWENKTSPLHAEAKTSHRETAPHAPCLHRDRAGGLRWLPGRALGNRSAQRPWHAVTGAGRERVETEERNVQTEMGGRGLGAKREARAEGASASSS